MQTTKRPYFLLVALTLVAVTSLALGGAFAGDEPTASPAADMPTAPAEKPATKTPSPMHSMMMWFASSVVSELDSPCPTCPKAEKAWRAWFSGGKDVALAGLRDRLVADGWNADRYIGYFQAMAKAKGEKASSCGSKGDCCGGCEGSKGDCSDCPSKRSCGEDKGCDGCPSKRNAETEPDTTAAK